MDLACKLNPDDAMHMYASLDLHKKYSQAVVMEGDGTITKEERIENSWENMEKFSDALPPGTDVVIESSSTWYWVYQILSRRHRVVLSKPVRAKGLNNEIRVRMIAYNAMRVASSLVRGLLQSQTGQDVSPFRTFWWHQERSWGFCRYCGNLVQAQAAFCNHCGKKLG